MSADASTYDDLPYDDAAYFHTHPSNLAVVATLCGLDPPPVAGCRVLELGCGGGFNLLAMAHSLPAARFVGVDLSPRQIEQGRATAAALGVDRVELHAGDIADVGESFGEFDYVIAHGVYSWVPDAVRAALLGVCKRSLAANGIAYVSYNTYPGWHVRTILRDVLRFHAPPGAAPLEQARAARAGVEELLAALPDPDAHYGRFLRGEVEALRSDPDSYLFHEFLEADNHPLRFEEFVRAAAGAGLRFVAEARFGTNGFARPSNIRQALSAVSDDLIRQEQYHDDLRNRSFRQSLLCHAAIEPTRTPPLAAVGRLRVIGSVELLGPADGGEGERVRVNGERVIVLSDPIGLAIFRCLHETGRRPVTVEALAARAAELIGRDRFPPGVPPVALVASWVVRGYADDLWLLFAYDPPFGAGGDRPRACPLARHQAGRGREVTNRLHRPVLLSEEERAVLLRLDGTTREQLAGGMTGGPGAVEAILKRLADAAVLVE